MVVVQNGASTARRRYRLGLPARGRGDVVLDTDAIEYGGDGGGPGAIEAGDEPWGGQPASTVITVPPLSVLFLRRAA